MCAHTPSTACSVSSSSCTLLCFLSTAAFRHDAVLLWFTTAMCVWCCSAFLSHCRLLRVLLLLLGASAIQEAQQSVAHKKQLDKPPCLHRLCWLYMAVTYRVLHTHS